MKASTTDALQTILDSDLVWRRKEISSLVSASKTTTFVAQKAIIRAAVPLLYAHWEGFGKECAVRYLEFVSYRRLAFNKLGKSFSYLHCYPMILEIAREPVGDGIEKLEKIVQAGKTINKNPFKRKINTRANLRWEVFVEILSLCGLDAAQFSTYSEFIDKELCDRRNDIAHGKSNSPSLDSFLETRSKAFALMTELQGLVVSSALSGAYKA